MFDVARLLGDALREVKTPRRPVPGAEQHRLVAPTSSSAARSAASRRGCSTSTAKAISSRRRPTPAISRSARRKYGKPVIDRVVTRDTSLLEATKCTLVSFDSTMRSNISVGPADRPARLRGRHACASSCSGAIEESDPYFQMVHTQWGEGLRRVFAQLPDPDWTRESRVTARMADPRRARSTARRYRFDRPVSLSPHEIRLRPAPHCRTPILGYSLQRRRRRSTSSTGSRTRTATGSRGSCFPSAPTSSRSTVDLVADMTVINPFDFFVEPYAETFPFAYAPALAKELMPFLETAPLGPRLAAWLERFRATIAARRDRRSTCWCG